MRRLVAAAVVLVLSAGCTQGFPDAPIGGGGSIGSGGSTTSIAGTYSLRTISGQPLPYTYRTSGADTYQVVSGAITLATDNTWTETQTERQTIGGVVTSPSFSDNGTYSVTGSAITFTSVASGTPLTSQGTIGSGQITLQGQALSGGPVVPMTYSK
jgi:hypothetical protein